MKKLNFEKIFVFGSVVITCFITYHLYKKGEVSLFNKPEGKGALSVEIPFLEKEYKLSFKKQDSLGIVNLVKFEENEKWEGDGGFDFNNFIEGESSLYLNSQDWLEADASVVLEEAINFEEYGQISFFIMVKTIPENIEKLNLELENIKGELVLLPIENLKNGWNLCTFFTKEIPFFDSNEKSIKKIKIHLKSRPKTISSLNFDLLTLSKEKNEINLFNANNSNALIYSKFDSKDLPLIISDFNQIITLKDVTSVKNFTFKTKITPIKPGSFGLFLRGDYSSGKGYCFVLNGISNNFWQFFVHKEKIKELKRGEIRNFMFKKNGSIWLKANASGSIFVLYLSIDGKDFIKIASVVDKTFSSGGVGFCGLDGSVFTVDEIELTR